MDFTGIIVIAVVVVMLILFLSNYRKDAAYRMVNARVKEVEVSERHQKKGETFTAYVPIYEYEVNGETYTARGAMTKDGNRHAIGNIRAIAVHKNDPENVRLVKHSIKARNMGLFLAIIGLLIIVLAYFLIA